MSLKALHNPTHLICKAHDAIVRLSSNGSPDTLPEASYYEDWQKGDSKRKMSTEIALQRCWRARSSLAICKAIVIFSPLSFLSLTLSFLFSQCLFLSFDHACAACRIASKVRKSFSLIWYVSARYSKRARSTRLCKAKGIKYNKIIMESQIGIFYTS